MKLFCRYSFWFARMRSDSPKTSKTPDLKGRLNMCVRNFTFIDNPFYKELYGSLKLFDKHSKKKILMEI